MDHMQFVKSLYLELLGRESGQEEAAYWFDKLNGADLAPEDVYAMFVSSDEYANRQKLRNLFVPPGHFYSPIVDPKTVQGFTQGTSEILDIDLREPSQLAYLRKIERHYPTLPFTFERNSSTRYYYGNPAFSYGDAIVLASTILEFRPAHLIEVGSGYSSGVTLDIVEQFLNWRTECTFIEPYPAVLHTILRPSDTDHIQIYPQLLQDVPLATFDCLEANDILFIDSSHVAKTGSDVVHCMFQILPRLKAGVLVHFHDIFYPFEYPEKWVLGENRSWNESYFLRAFLTNNVCWRIVFFNSFMAYRYGELLRQVLPDFVRNSGGSIWLRKIR